MSSITSQTGRRGSWKNSVEETNAESPPVVLAEKLSNDGGDEENGSAVAQGEGSKVEDPWEENPVKSVSLIRGSVDGATIHIEAEPPQSTATSDNC